MGLDIDMITAEKEYAKEVDKAIFPGMQGGPLMHIIAAKAVSFKEALTPEFMEYQKKIKTNASAFAKSLKDHNFRLVSDGTDNHLILIDLTDRGVTGKDLEVALDKAGITVNKNTVPSETRSPFVTSGIRVGTPAVTTRGFGEEEMGQLAEWLDRVASNIDDESILTEVRNEVLELCNKFPLYEGFDL